MRNGSLLDNISRRWCPIDDDAALAMSPDYSYFAKLHQKKQRLDEERVEPTTAERVLTYPSPLKAGCDGDQRSVSGETPLARRLKEYQGMFLDLANTGELFAAHDDVSSDAMEAIAVQDTQLSPPTISSPTQRSSSSSFPSQFSSSGSTSSLESTPLMPLIQTTRTIHIHGSSKTTSEEFRWRTIRDKYMRGDRGEGVDMSQASTAPSTVSLFVGGTYKEDDEDAPTSAVGSTGSRSVVYLRLVQEDGTIHHVRMGSNTPFSWLVLSGYEGFHMYFRHRRLKWSHTPASQGFDTLQTSPDFPVSVFLVSAKSRDMCPTTRHRIGALGSSTLDVLLVPKWQLQPNANPQSDPSANVDEGISIEKIDVDGDEPAGRKVTLRCVLPCAINTIVDILCAEGVLTYEGALDLHIASRDGEEDSSGGMVACKRTRRGLYEMITTQSILKEGDELYLGGV